MPFLRYFFLSVLLIALLVVGWAGFRGEKSVKPPLMIFPDMDYQAKVKFQERAEFFPDQAGARLPVAGTVPMGLSIPALEAGSSDWGQSLAFTAGNDYFHTGRIGDYWGDGMPEEVTVDASLVRRGAERYNIFCAPCHGYSGDGQGIAAKYNLAGIANLHLPPFSDPADPTYRTDGRMFHVITYGQGLMGPYGAQIPVQDRWAIVAYVRTLQLAKSAPANEGGEEPLVTPPGADEPLVTPPGDPVPAEEVEADLNQPAVPGSLPTVPQTAPGAVDAADPPRPAPEPQAAPRAGGREPLITPPAADNL